MDKIASEQTRDVANRVGRVADRAREAASDAIPRRSEPGRGAALAASAIGVASTSLETVSERAQLAGNALRDRGRDAARALGRGERVLRERGFGGAAGHTATFARRHARKLAVAVAGLLTLFTMRRLRRNG